jgi:(2Fe-2S) ferredoxin
MVHEHRIVSESAIAVPIAVVYPEGVWYGGLTPEAVEEIMDQHIEGGGVAEKYII